MARSRRTTVALSEKPAATIPLCLTLWVRQRLVLEGGLYLLAQYAGHAYQGTRAYRGVPGRTRAFRDSSRAVPQLSVLAAILVYVQRRERW